MLNIYNKKKFKKWESSQYAIRDNLCNINIYCEFTKNKKILNKHCYQIIIVY